MYCAYVTRIHNLRKHTNADRLLCGECFGNTVIVDLGTDPDQLGVYFPTDGKLGLEFAQKNDLLRRTDENGAPAGGYLDPEKRNIKALKLRGEKSDGLFLPLSCLASFTDIKKLQEGDTISVLNGITICEKYVPAVKRSFGSGGGGNRVRKRSDPISPLFQEHADTEQLAYNLSAFHAGDLVEVTLKMHGTSQRTGYLPVLQGYKYRNGKVFHDIKGNPTEIAHFYHHERVGAYDSFCYTGDLSPNQRLTVALLIRWHMWPYAVEKSDNPSKTVSKIERLLGNDIWNQVMVLNTCDRNAH